MKNIMFRITMLCLFSLSAHVVLQLLSGTGIIYEIGMIPSFGFDVTEHVLGCSFVTISVMSFKRIFRGIKK